MTAAPSPANPELLQAVKDLIYEEIWKEFNPAEQSTTLDGTKQHRVWKDCQHLLQGLSPRDFQVLVDKRLDEETAILATAWMRIKELRIAAHPPKAEAG